MFYYVILIVFLLFHCISSFPHCISEVGDDVDWFYIYKVPRDKAHPDPRVQRGVAYMYMTSKTYKFGWLLSEFSIDESKSMLAQTLNPLYQKSSKSFSVIYNDQPPVQDEPSNHLRDIMYGPLNNQTARAPVFEDGHTKGVVLGDAYTGVWLVHSVPKFPPIPDGNTAPNMSYHYPETGMKFGQSFLCVSVATTTINQIGIQLNFNEPLILYSHIADELKSIIPNVVNVAEHKSVQVAPWYHIENFVTLEGRKFTSFAKSGKFNADLYAGLVSDELKSNLLTETWINGAGVLDSECHKEFKVYNIEGIKFPLLNVSFTSHYDHSKWLIAEAPRANRIEIRRHVSLLKILKGLKRKTNVDADDYWICVGDINRALSQERRGGGTVCTSDSILWNSYKSLVKSVEPCQ